VTGNGGLHWTTLLSAEEREVIDACGYGRRVGYGSRPAVLVIDVNYNFVGDVPEPVRESVKRFPFSCGQAGWDAIPHLQRLLGAARASEAPVIYCTGRWSDAPGDMGVLADLNPRLGEIVASGNVGAEIVRDIAPQPGDILLEKHYPSMFFGTPLMSHLHALAIDTLIITGCSTSGCVRATAVDAYSYNFHPIVVEECVFDRIQFAHHASLLDLDTKYADVVALSDALSYLAGLAQVAA
jgi:nicotinamidase-related amidase